MPAAVTLANVSRAFDGERILDNVTLDIPNDEVCTILGPQGAGKSTLLRLIAGLDEPTSGEIRIMGEDMFAMPAYRRPVNTVFQDYALFPHLTAAQNVAYGLMIAGEGKARRLRLADEALEMVNLSGCSDLRPDRLSDDQRQRVALARALIMKPSILLLDEPFGGLDTKMRGQMQVELKNLQRELGITFIIASCDHSEALSMSDQLVVLSKGKIEQIGTPKSIYFEPSTPFVAGFVGSANVFPPEITHLLTGRRCYASLRPEAIRVMAKGKSARVLSCAFLGASTRLQLDMAGTVVTALIPKTNKVPEEGQMIHVGWKDTDLHVMEDA